MNRDTTVDGLSTQTGRSKPHRIRERVRQRTSAPSSSRKATTSRLLVARRGGATTSSARSADSSAGASSTTTSVGASESGGARDGVHGDDRDAGSPAVNRLDGAAGVETLQVCELVGSRGQ